MNLVILCGRLTKDPEIRQSQSDKPMTIARFTLAVNKDFKPKEGQPTADYINCIAFGKTAETIEKCTHKGMKIIAKGSWQTGNYTNKDGNKVYTNDCLVQSIEFCESKNASQQQESDSGFAVPKMDGGFMNVSDSDLPF